MSEKKQVLYDLKAAYSGPFVMEDFYADVDGWISHHGFIKEPKKKMEHITNSGKKIEWLIEVQIHLDDLHHGIIILRVLADNVREVVIKRQKKKMRINNGDVFIDVNAFIESEIHGSIFQVKPVYYFIRALIDKYIHNFWSDKWDGYVNAHARELFDLASGFFNKEKKKYS